MNLPAILELDNILMNLHDLDMSCADLQEYLPDLSELIEQTDAINQFDRKLNFNITGRYTELRHKFRLLCGYVISFKNTLESPSFQCIFNIKQKSYDLDQTRIFIYIALQNYVRVSQNIISHALKVNFLSKEEICELHSFEDLFLNKISILKDIISKNTDFKFENSQPLNQIGPHHLKIPIHILIEPDDDEYHLSCFETPQIFGCGRSIKEAKKMFVHEFLSMKNELNEFSEMSFEMACLKYTLNYLI